MTDADFRRLNIRRVHTRVSRIDPQSHRVHLQGGSTLSYDRLLIAVGAEAQKANVPGETLEGVLKLDNLEDARRILRMAKRGRTAVVVGGGITALELVEGFQARGVKAHYFLRGDRYWSNVLDETESHIVEDRLLEEGVKIHYHTELEEILGKGGRVYGVRTKDGKTIPCDMVGIAIGIRPRKELAEHSGIQVERGVLVTEMMQTSEADVFAAGDIAQVFDPFTGKSVLDSLWGPAREQGTAAGMNMAGITTPYHKIVAFNVTRLAELTTTIIGQVGHGKDLDTVGIVRGDSEVWREPPDAIAAQSDFEINRLRILVGQNTLVGALVMGDQTLSRPLQHLVNQKVDITSIRQDLLTPGASLADILVEFWKHSKPEVAFAAH
jgi:NAD(P)H-nitrite reductase large subunit